MLWFDINNNEWNGDSVCVSVLQTETETKNKNKNKNKTTQYTSDHTHTS